MINYETILSTFDDKLTLLQWLQKVEQALEGAGLESVEVHQQTPTTAYFKFIFADGTSVTTPSVTLPRGAKGDTGATGATGATGNGIASISKTGSSGLVDTYTILYTNGSTQTFTVTNGAQGEAGQDGADGADGVGIDNVEINSNTGVLTVTLTDETEINAGNVYTIVTVSGTSGTITDPATLLKLRNYNTFVKRTSNNDPLMVWHHTDNLNHVQYFYRVNVETGILNYCDITQAQFAVDVTTGAWTYTETNIPYMVDVDRLSSEVEGTPATSGKVISADGDGGVAWDTIGAETIGSGTATNGQVLTADGSGGASWQNASGGSLYMHCITLQKGNMNIWLTTSIINKSSNALTLNDLIKFIYITNSGKFSSNEKLYHATGVYYDGTNNYNVVGIRGYSSTHLRGVYFFNGTATNFSFGSGDVVIYDAVIEI